MTTPRAIGLRYWLLMGILILVSGTDAHADFIPLTATLTGSQEIPPNTSPGIGSAALILDDVNHTLASAVTFSGLTSPTTSADIETRSGLVIHSFPTVPIGETQGSFADIWTGLTARDVSALEFGNGFINIRTSTFPGGEIRGPAFVPEPASLVLLGTGLLAPLGAWWLCHGRSRVAGEC